MLLPPLTRAMIFWSMVPRLTPVAIILSPARAGSLRFCRAGCNCVTSSGKFPMNHSLHTFRSQAIHCVDFALASFFFPVHGAKNTNANAEKTTGTDSRFYRSQQVDPQSLSSREAVRLYPDVRGARFARLCARARRGDFGSDRRVRSAIRIKPDLPKLTTTSARRTRSRTT